MEFKDSVIIKFALMPRKLSDGEWIWFKEYQSLACYHKGWDDNWSDPWYEIERSPVSFKYEFYEGSEKVIRWYNHSSHYILNGFNYFDKDLDEARNSQR